MRALTLSLCLLLPACIAAEEAWQPEKTWVFAAGILNFANKKLGTWPDEGRVDAVMIEALKKRGVPEGQIVFVKNSEATHEALTTKLDELLKKTAEGDTLLFYYAGHGARDWQDVNRPASLVCYDAKGLWAITDVLDRIEKGFKGANVLLTADCCHSGAFADAAASRTKFRTGVLTSSHASSRSTGNWTFTQCLVDMFNGSPLLDSDNNGQITFGETAAYAEQEMAFAEQQLSCSACAGKFNRDTVMATASGKRTGRVGERCEGLSEGKWYKARILEEKDGKLFVTWLGWDRKWDCWVEPKDLRPHKPQVYEGGTEVEVEWDGKWYKAKVMQNRLGMHLVHYDGYGDNDDEWVPFGRIRLPKKDK